MPFSANQGDNGGTRNTKRRPLLLQRPNGEEISYSNGDREAIIPRQDLPAIRKLHSINYLSSCSWESGGQQGSLGGMIMTRQALSSGDPMRK